jgi:hypothetical protein
MMDFNINLAIGVLAIAYGLYSHVRRKTAAHKIDKLQTLIERNGEKMGHSIYMFGHTILPIVAGLMLLYAHYQG